MRLLHVTTVVIGVVLGGSSLQAQVKDSPLLGPLTISTGLTHGWTIELVVKPDATDTRVKYSQSSLVSQVFEPSVSSVSISIKDCNRMAETLEEAAMAAKEGKRFDSDLIGEVTISVGMGEVYVPDTMFKKGGMVKQKVVILEGGERGAFARKIRTQLPPKDAIELAKSMRAAPAICARLKSSINFDALWKEK